MSFFTPPVLGRLLWVTTLGLHLAACDVLSGEATTRLESDGSASGFRVAVDGATALVASSGNGPVAIYERGPDGWSRTADLLADGVEVGSDARDQYGWAVALGGDVAVVGAYGTDDRRGAAYVFERAGASWAQTARLQPAGLVGQSGQYSGDGSHFGSAVAVGGGQVFVSRPGDGGGAVYVYERGPAGWAVADVVEAPDPASEWAFGRYVATDGFSLVVSGRLRLGGEGSTANGVAYVFRRGGTGWEPEARLDSGIPYDELDGPPNSPRGDGLGAVDIDGDVVVAGAPNVSVGGARSAGAVFVFERAGGVWKRSARLVPDDAGADDYVGMHSVAVEGSVVIAPSDFKGATGAVYTFERSGGAWAQVDKLVEHDVPRSQAFGISVGLDGGTLIVGAPYEDDEDGAAYVYRRSGQGWAR